MRRAVRGLGALAALLGALVGVPAALVVLGGNPLPRRWDAAGLLETLLRPDDGTVLVGLVTVVAWLAWLVFAVSVLVELRNLVSGRPRLRLPGLGGVQRAAAGLLLAVLAMVATPQLVHRGETVPAAPAQVAPATPTRPVAPTDPDPVLARPEPGQPPPVVAARDSSVPPAATAAAGTRQHIHVVRTGDDLWSLAERYYGQGRDWRRIAAANPDVLSGGPDRLGVGWRLVVPDVDDQVDEDRDRDDQEHVRVRAGDTLSAIADRELGSSRRWPELFEVNRDQLDDPDELPVGVALAVPADAPRSRPHPPASRTEADPPDPRPTTPAPPGRDPSPPQDPVASLPPSAAPPTGATPEAAGPTPAGGTGATTEAEDREAAVPAGLAAVGGLLAAGLLGGLALRRRLQLQARPVGRRIAHPPAALQSTEVALGRRAQPLSLRTLDRATRAVAAHCRSAGVPLPELQLAYVGDSEIELVMAEVAPDAPVCFTVHDRRWRLARADASYLSSVPGMSDAARPWPTLVTLGRDEQGRQVLADLESLGLLGLTGTEEQTTAVLAALAVELSFSPWTEEMTLTLVGGDDALPAALGQHNVARCDDVDALLDRLERRAREQRAQGAAAVLAQRRVDPDLADAWVPEVVLVQQGLTPAQGDRLTALTTGQPRVTLAAVVGGGGVAAAWSLDLRTDDLAVLSPEQAVLVPQALPAPGLDAVVGLVEATGSLETTPAPWWGAEEAEPPERPPDNVTYLGQRSGSGDDGSGDEDERRAAVQARMTGSVRYPTLQLLGPVELRGAAGPPPPRAAKQCLEYCAWLLENPGTTAQAMAAALVVAEGTRRSNMSRLRSWLGADPQGQPYLPDAYTGRIRLDACVSSDWQQLQVLTVAGVNRSSSASLELALELVRGAPLADAAPGQWHWAEELRTDLISCVRDVGVELTGRALAAGQVDLARWAASRALVASPGDELLLAARVRTEHLAGNAAETERLSLQLAQQARLLGVDLDPATVSLLQEVVEGRIRARMA